jgi:hypothetical protein
VTAVVAGPSGGVLGNGQETFDRGYLAAHPDDARKLINIGRHRRAGYDRTRWAAVNWDDYRASVGIPQRRGPWTLTMAEERPGEPSQWVAEASGLPWRAGWYTTLTHAGRGLVMSDIPAEVAGSLAFLDRIHAEGAERGPRRVLVSGLGLGIVPRWLLHHAAIERIDVVEYEWDIVVMTAIDAAAVEDWAGDPRLHVHLGDAHTWRPEVMGCALHTACRPPGGPLMPAPAWHAAWHDIWDTVSAANLPSMHRLHRRYGRRVGWQMSWDRAECEAMRRRGQTLERPSFGCLIAEAGYGGVP